MKHDIKMNLVKETKNTQVYGTSDESAVVTQLYIKKSAFAESAPKQITVTIE